MTRPDAALQSLDAGAQFLTSDGFHPTVIEFGAKRNVVVIPGTLTPTEVISAWETNADFVKVVPCAQLGGPTYIASLHAMFPDIPLIASGGVDQLSASKLVLAGAIALGVGRELIPREAIQHRQAARIRGTGTQVPGLREKRQGSPGSLYETILARGLKI